jgi:hypothetical protein
MHLRKRIKSRILKRGSVLVQGVVFGGAVGVGVAALAIDTGLMFNAKQELRNAADATALAAASQLGETEGGTSLAGVEAVRFAALNEVAGLGISVDIDTDVTYGHAVMNGEKFDFQPGVLPYDAARITLRRDATVADGPVSLLFAKTFGMRGANLTATATAMLIPRDIALVIDLSGSMNDDSELRHYDDFPSEIPGDPDKPGVQIDLKDIWLALPILKGNSGVGNGLDPPPPGNPNSENDAEADATYDQPATGPGNPMNAGGNPDPGAEPLGGTLNPTGPRWGWMTGWGEPVVLGSYTPVGDFGLYRIPRNAACQDADVAANLTESGYTANERAALLHAVHDEVATNYRNRVLVMTGLAGWKSKKMIGTEKDSKYTGGPGNGDDVIDTNELTQQIGYTFAAGSWENYIDYVKSGTVEMVETDSNFRYQYGIKTFTNYLLEKRAQNAQCPELAAAPEEPLYSVKNAVQAMVDELISLETQDYLSLETFAQYGYHAHDLTVPASPELLADAWQEIPDTLDTYQAGHYTSTTNIGAGLQEGIDELTSVRARTATSKIIILLTDGKPNVNEYDAYVGNNHAEAIAWVEASADEAKELGMTIYTIGVGGDVNPELLADIATSVDHYFFADNSPDPDNDGQPMYVTQLQQIFQTLGGNRPVRLIQ